MDEEDKLCFLCQKEENDELQVIAILDTVKLCDICLNGVLTNLEEGKNDYDEYFDLWE